MVENKTRHDRVEKKTGTGAEVYEELGNATLKSIKAVVRKEETKRLKRTKRANKRSVRPMVSRL